MLEAVGEPKVTIVNAIASLAGEGHIFKDHQSNKSVIIHSPPRYTDKPVSEIKNILRKEKRTRPLVVQAYTYKKIIMNEKNGTGHDYPSVSESDWNKISGLAPDVLDQPGQYFLYSSRTVLQALFRRNLLLYEPVFHFILTPGS